MKDILDILAQLGGVVNSWKELGMLAALIALANVLTNLTKLPMLSKRIPANWRPWITVALSAVTTFLAAVADGGGVGKGVVGGIIAGLGAIGVHESTAAVLEKSKRQAKESITAALSGADHEVKAKVASLKDQLDKAAAIPDKKARLKALADWAGKVAKDGAAKV